jgi:hypothetical protein
MSLAFRFSYISSGLNKARNVVARCQLVRDFGIVTSDQPQAEFLELERRLGSLPSQLDDEQFSDKSLGALKSIPKLMPWHEYVGIAVKRANEVEEDTSIRNSKIRARKLAAASLSTLSKELTVPLGDAFNGFKMVTSGLPRLHPFERTLAKLTLRNMEREGHGTLETALDSIKLLRKETSLCMKASIALGANANTAKEVTHHSATSLAHTSPSAAAGCVAQGCVHLGGNQAVGAQRNDPLDPSGPAAPTSHANTRTQTSTRARAQAVAESAAAAASQLLSSSPLCLPCLLIACC